MTHRDTLDQANESPKLSALYFDAESNAEAMRLRAEKLTVQVQAFVDAARPTLERVLNEVGAMFTELANSSQIRALADERRVQRRAMKTEYNRRRSRRGKRH